MRKRRNEENLPSSSSSSSTDSSNTNNNNGYYEVSFNSKDDLSTDLRLGLSIFSHELSSSSSRGQYSDWPPIKQLLRSTLAAGKSNNNINNNINNNNIINNNNNNNSRRETLYVKVYMEGIPIGRKLNLLAHHGYHGLITTLVHMFRTTILYPDIAPPGSPLNCHILTYEDKDGDWMMVGDVPWEMFITTVKRLKIVAYERCQ